MQGVAFKARSSRSRALATIGATQGQHDAVASGVTAPHPSVMGFPAINLVVDPVVKTHDQREMSFADLCAPSMAPFQCLDWIATARILLKSKPGWPSFGNAPKTGPAKSAGMMSCCFWASCP